MKLSTKILLPLLTCGLYSSGALADRYCVQNVDNLQLFYVNGRLTRTTRST